MKQGDKFPVTIAGQTVAEATVREVGEGQVTLVVPGTIVVMATQTNIAPEAVVPENTTVSEPEKETIITGVDRVSGEVGAAVETSSGAVETSNTNGGSGETPQPAPPQVSNPGESEPQAAPAQPDPTPANPATVSDDAQPTA